MAQIAKGRPLCACGCGKGVGWSRDKREWCKFVKGHNLSLPVTEEWREGLRKGSCKRHGSPVDRFRSYQGRPTENGCVPWLGYTDKKGYGLIGIANTQRRAPRFAWELAFGAIPKGKLICHTCDNPWCTNPEHLFVGSLADNVADMNAKERQARGSRQGNAKLTEDDVIAIKAMLRRGWMGIQLSKIFGVTPKCISLIKRGVNWKHI